jgi:hypothetical protein
VPPGFLSYLKITFLIGPRRAGWVPLTNGIYCAVKIASCRRSYPARRRDSSWPLRFPGAPPVVLVTILALEVASQLCGVAEAERLDPASRPVRDRRPFLGPHVAGHDRVADRFRIAEA